jgi:hypothetical protein
VRVSRLVKVAVLLWVARWAARELASHAERLSRRRA